MRGAVENRKALLQHLSGLYDIDTMLKLRTNDT
jgi:hypothetical protein